MQVLNSINRKECECGALLQYENKDIDIDGYIICPCCGKRIKVRNKNEIIYPEDYYCFNGIDISKERINSYIKDGIKDLKENKDEDYWITGTGNTMIFIFKNDENKEFDVYVCKNYYEGYVEY